MRDVERRIRVKKILIRGLVQAKSNG